MISKQLLALVLKLEVENIKPIRIDPTPVHGPYTSCVLQEVFTESVKDLA